MNQLDTFITGVGDPVLVLHDGASAEVVADGTGREVHPSGGVLPDRKHWAGVVLVVTDRGALRRAVATLPQLGRTSAVACLLTDEEHPAHVVPRPERPPITRLAARVVPSGGALTILRLQGSVPAHRVLLELARAAGSSRPGPARILLATAPGLPRRFQLPPEIVVVAEPGAPVEEYDAAVAPAPLVVADTELARGPIDEGVINPIGFHSEPDQGIGVLAGAQEVTPRTVAMLRNHQGLHVDWTEPTPELARTVAALAMAGIPLVGGPPPTAVRPWLGEELSDALSHGPDVTHLLRREEHSIRLR